MKLKSAIAAAAASVVVATAAVTGYSWYNSQWLFQQNQPVSDQLDTCAKWGPSIGNDGYNPDQGTLEYGSACARYFFQDWVDGRFAEAETLIFIPSGATIIPLPVGNPMVTPQDPHAFLDTHSNPVKTGWDNGTCMVTETSHQVQCTWKNDPTKQALRSVTVVVHRPNGGIIDVNAWRVASVGIDYEDIAQPPAPAPAPQPPIQVVPPACAPGCSQAQTPPTTPGDWTPSALSAAHDRLYTLYKSTHYGGTPDQVASDGTPGPWAEACWQPMLERLFPNQAQFNAAPDGPDSFGAPMGTLQYMLNLLAFGGCG